MLSESDDGEPTRRQKMRKVSGEETKGKRRKKVVDGDDPSDLDYEG
jgi:hypothetical protein